METPACVHYTSADSVATVTLSRPDVYNAFNGQLHQELAAALKRAEGDPAVRCVILTGAGRGFCSGQDLNELPADQIAPAIARVVRERYNPLVTQLRRMGKPVIAAVNGVAAGAGMSLALACDIRIAAESARFVAAFVNIGLIPDSGMTYLLPRLIGQARALELCITGGAIDAPTALAWGLASQVVPDAELAEAAQALARRLAAGPATAISLTKRAIERAQVASLAEMLEYEAQAQQVAGSHADFREGLRAFREKRPPQFNRE